MEKAGCRSWGLEALLGCASEYALRCKGRWVLIGIGLLRWHLVRGRRVVLLDLVLVRLARWAAVVVLMALGEWLLHLKAGMKERMALLLLWFVGWPISTMLH